MKKAMLLESMTLPKTKFLRLKYSSAFRRQTTQRNTSCWRRILSVFTSSPTTAIGVAAAADDDDDDDDGGDDVTDDDENESWNHG